MLLISKRLQALIVIFITFVAISFFLLNYLSKDTATFSEIMDRPWHEYTDQEFNFKISFPSNLKQDILTESVKTPVGTRVKSVSFYNKNLELGLVGVKVYSHLKFDNIDEFLDILEKNKPREYLFFFKEKDIWINNIRGVVYHEYTKWQGKEEHYSTSKKVVFLVEGELFELWTRFGDGGYHEKVWDNFSFESSLE